MITAPGGTASAEAVAAALRDADRITAICHENPDADTIGAAIAIRLIGERLGKRAEIVSADRPGPAFAFLPRYAEILRRPALEPDLAVVCDAATLERVGRLTSDEPEWFRRVTLVNIDHHVTNTHFGDLNLVDPTAAATCQFWLSFCRTSRSRQTTSLPRRSWWASFATAMASRIRAPRLTRCGSRRTSSRPGHRCPPSTAES
ncbi:MAG TPA: DHH family phosphoesterase [Candidatus Limnocylindrales bacterium]|nr:DHH family phosphoesterase [Candidatus Limnocylindrales bacterium]